MQEPSLPAIFFYILFTGLPVTLQLTAHGLVWGFVLGLILALMRVYTGKELNWIPLLYEKILRGIPLLVLIIVFAVSVPGIFWMFDPRQRALAGVILALALRSGAYQSQIIRGAILSVHPGQLLAARSIGMSRLQAFRHIVLPQALRISVPSWSNEYAVVLKDTSFAYAVGIIEMVKLAFYVGGNYPALLSPLYVIVAILYFICTYPVTRLFGEQQTKKLKELGMGG